ncbi:hypothetical protein MTR67_030662 [Solanum verrucosum]|uniref:DNA mismatch repair protein MutS core domain-containing protein n=1 Tax=Solanum verrucosum TaxID=315347 RepID=A0AAF0RBD5_SOLVR|nr:hypothetical protein MTR67_030662 [Solanum verrucosum]
MTQSGVGKCRQVGISESGIDEAVQKLLARGNVYYVLNNHMNWIPLKARRSHQMLMEKDPSEAFVADLENLDLHLLKMQHQMTSLHGMYYSPKDGSWYHLPNLFDGAVNIPVAPVFKNFPDSVRHYHLRPKRVTRGEHPSPDAPSLLVSSRDSSMGTWSCDHLHHRKLRNLEREKVFRDRKQYKVGRMEQLETSEQAKSRGSTSVIRRKLVHVLTPSTTSEGNIGPDAVHLLAVKENCNELGNGSTTIGFAFVDCAALKVWVGSIDDDASCAALGALLVQVSPKEVIFNARGLSKDAQKALKKYSSTGPAAPLLSPVQPGADFVDPAEVKNFLDLKGYFKRSCNKWDHTFDGENHNVALCALGILVNHLERLMLDEVLHNGDVLSYEVYKGCLRMDGQTLVNLEIFNNNADGCTLYMYLDNCVTLPGKRLLRKWICHPLKDVEKINHRLDVVDKLVNNSDATLSTAQYLRKLPDLDRLLGRVKASIQSSEALLLPLIGAKILKQRVSLI